MSQAPQFRSIATPLEVADADLDLLNRQLGVPTLVTAPSPVPPAETQPEPAPRAPVRAINVHLPDYAIEALKAKAFEAQSSVRYIVMRALHDAGITIRDEDLIEDARRTRSLP